MLARKVFYGLVVLVIVVAVAAGGLTVALAGGPNNTQAGAQAAQSNTPARGITVVGIGKATGRPDIARVTVGIETQDASLQKAVDDNKSKMNALLETLQKEGLAAKDIRTSNYSVYTERVSPPAAGAEASAGASGFAAIAGAPVAVPKRVR